MTPLLTIEECARILRISTSTLYKMTSGRRIPFMHVGSRVMFDPEKIQAWLEERSVEPLKSRD